MDLIRGVFLVQLVDLYFLKRGIINLPHQAIGRLA